MTKDNRRILTWSLNAGSTAYVKDLEQNWNKIYSVGLHEFGVTGEGKIYDFRSSRNYFDANGNHTGVRFPVVIENDMLKYPTIKWYAQIILFGWNKVKPVLDNVSTNSEGRLPQDQFLHELNKVLDIYETTRSTGRPLNLSGIEMDVESSMTSDTVSQGMDVKYVHFLERIKNEVLIPRKLKQRVNAHAMWGNNVPYYYRFHNYKLFAESADKNGNATIDEIQLMTYDFAWAGSSAGASTPIWWFRNVAEWCKENFDPSVNPNAKLTIDKLFFGSAGYGHRWGMSDQADVKRGSVITFRNLLGWQNGMYKHYHTENIDGKTTYMYHDQPYLFQTSFQDDESKNEIMYPHVYDRFEPKYVNVKTIDGGKRTATVGTYNRLDYATSNVKGQDPIWTNVHAIANKPTNVSGKAFATSPAKAGLETDAPQHYADLRVADSNMNMDDLNFRHHVKTVDGIDKAFVSYYNIKRRYYPARTADDKLVCIMEEEPDGRIEYTVNVPSAKKYRIVALTNFSWYSQATLGGTINGQEFVVGGDNMPEWNPYVMKGSHWVDVGSYTLQAGNNTIVVDGAKSAQSTPIYGFVVCDAFDANLSGGELDLTANIQPMLGKDGEPTKLPERFALASKMLRRDARPAILWDDEFRTYEEGTKISSTSYYQSVMKNYQRAGAGTIVGQNSAGNDVCYSEPYDVGFSQGDWIQKEYKLNFNASDNSDKTGQLVLSKEWSVNLSIEGTIQVVSGQSGGIRFYAQKEGSANDGYIFRMNFDNNRAELVYEDGNAGTSQVVASQMLNTARRGMNIILRVVSHNGKGLFYVGGVQVFRAGTGNPVEHNGSVDTVSGEVTLARSRGAVGIYAYDSEVNCTHLGIGTTDRWETMEKFEIEIDGNRQEFGRIKRTGYSYDEFGYLIYSGLNEINTRDTVQTPFDEDAYAVSLDYEITVLEAEAWAGAKNVKLKLRDAGVWFGELLIGDKEGMSIIWAGDAWSFLDVMNIAVGEYGAKGIGLWTMGQEDPYLFELVPDVVSKN